MRETSVKRIHITKETNQNLNEKFPTLMNERLVETVYKDC